MDYNEIRVKRMKKNELVFDLFLKKINPNFSIFMRMNYKRL